MAETDEPTAETIAFLVAEAGGEGRVSRVTTHISEVVIGRDVVLKLKRPVATPYLDFSTPERRLATCAREVALNQPAAPAIYRRARRITREADGRLGWDGAGALVDGVVEMAPFDREMELDRVIARGRLTAPLVNRLAAMVVASHARAETDTGRAEGAARMARVLDIDAAAFVTSGLMGREEAAIFDGLFRRALDRHAARLDARAAAGRVRRCHGDLHAGNIVIVDGEPLPFDALEFDEDLATTDTLYDLAFLVMDVWRRGEPAHARALLDRVADATGEVEDLVLMPFFVATRAAVRAHVGAAWAKGLPEAERARALLDARAYATLARAALADTPARLVAIGGLSGTGKSTLARALAPRIGPPPGARVLSSDRVRKRRAGVAATTTLPPEAYTPEAAQAVYADMFDQAARLVAAGGSVVLDAVFTHPPSRPDAEAAAGSARFDGLWLELDPDTARARVAARRDDPSDATVAVLERQLAFDPGEISWARIDAAKGEVAAAEALGLAPFDPRPSS
jgi:hypothetical protein